MQAILRLVPRGRALAVEHVLGDLLARVRREAVEHDRVVAGLREQLGVDPVRLEELAASEEGSRVVLAAPVDWSGAGGEKKRRGRRQRERDEVLRIAELKRAGFFRALSSAGETVEIPDDLTGIDVKSAF